MSPFAFIRNEQEKVKVRRILVGFVLLVLAGGSHATDIKGKWGLGVGIGPTKWRLLEIETSLIRGKTERTAWILDFNADQTYSQAKDSTGHLLFVTRVAHISLGPRIRRFTRPKERFSPYWDVFIHGHGSNSGTNDTYTRLAGVETGLAGGVEYFTPWHFSLAAHTSLLTVEATRMWSKGYHPQWEETTTLGLSPLLQLRVYF